MVQHAAVRNLRGYSKARAPSIGLTDAAHKMATAVQRSTPKSVRGTLGAEYSVSRQSLIAAGVPADVIARTMNRTGSYFRGLGFGPGTKTRAVGSGGIKDKGIFGSIAAALGFGAKSEISLDQSTQSSSNANNSGGDEYNNRGK